MNPQSNKTMYILGLFIILFSSGVQFVQAYQRNCSGLLPQLEVVDVNNAEELIGLVALESKGRDVRFTADGDYLLIQNNIYNDGQLSQRSLVVVWDIRTLQISKYFPLENAFLQVFSYSPALDQVVYATADGNIYTYNLDAEDPNLVGTISEEMSIAAIDYLPSGNNIVIATEEGSLSIFDTINTNDFILTHIPEPIIDLIILDEIIVIASENMLYAWQYPYNTDPISFSMPHSVKDLFVGTDTDMGVGVLGVSQVSWASFNTTPYNSVSIDLELAIENLEAETNFVTGTANSEGSILALANDHGEIEVWRVVSQDRVNVMQEINMNSDIPLPTINAVVFNENETLLASISNLALEVWGIPDGCP